MKIACVRMQTDILIKYNLFVLLRTVNKSAKKIIRIFIVDTRKNNVIS